MHGKGPVGSGDSAETPLIAYSNFSVHLGTRRLCLNHVAAMLWYSVFAGRDLQLPRDSRNCKKSLQ